MADSLRRLRLLRLIISFNIIPTRTSSVSSTEDWRILNSSWYPLGRSNESFPGFGTVTGVKRLDRLTSALLFGLFEDLLFNYSLFFCEFAVFYYSFGYICVCTLSFATKYCDATKSGSMRAEKATPKWTAWNIFTLINHFCEGRWLLINSGAGFRPVSCSS